MNVWIFVISTVFAPVFEPLGLPTPTADTVVVSPDDPVVESIDLPFDDMRYHGLERMLAELDAPPAP